MNLLHSTAGPLTPAEVRGRLGKDLAYTTVVTVLSRMHDKGLLRRAKDGRAFRYAPVADPHGMTARRMRQELEADSDPGAVLARFVDELPASDEELLRRLLGPDLLGER